MKTLKNCILAFILLSVATACKKEDKTSDPSSQQDNTEPAVQVVFDMVVNKDDTFELFYTEDESLNFPPANSVRVDVKGKPESQEIIFNLPDSAQIGNLRFDPGQNPDQDKMTIVKLIIKQGDKEMELSAADFFKYFQATDYVKVDLKTLSFTSVPLQNVYDPILYGNTTFMQALRELKK